MSRGIITLDDNFTLVTDDKKRHHYKKGPMLIDNVPDEHMEHWFFKAHVTEEPKSLGGPAETTAAPRVAMSPGERMSIRLNENPPAPKNISLQAQSPKNSLKLNESPVMKTAAPPKPPIPKGK